ncbi:MAG: sialate O-acetylesterase, partial [Verrucomicrobiales bacterium]
MLPASPAPAVPATRVAVLTSIVLCGLFRSANAAAAEAKPNQTPAAQTPAGLSLASVFSDHMVLQRQIKVPVWGQARPDEMVTVTFNGQSKSAVTGQDGRWMVKLDELEAERKPAELAVSDSMTTIKFTDVLVGEVWLASGQSNMEKPLGPGRHQVPCLDWQEEVAAADYPQIRLLDIPVAQAAEPASSANGQWATCSPESIVLTPSRGVGFSACAYFFGRKLHIELNIPIGLISATRGGTACESWTPGPSGDLYNGMIAPLTPLAMRGAIWYQGESNVGAGLSYADKMKALIEGWRRAWGYDFSFYFVQIAPFGGYSPNSLPPIWEAQVSNLKIPRTGMAVTTDLVNAISDIHPVNKVDIGHRLALWALAKDYKRELVFSGPLYKSIKVEGRKIRLSFAHVGGGLKTRDGKPLTEFEVADGDGKFVPAEASLEGDTVVVQAREVAAPVQARLGWHNEANPNLVNNEGLPASPFHTSGWQGLG